MSKISGFCFFLLLIINIGVNAQQKFSLGDTLRGTITPERAWWDVQRYDLSFTPDYKNKTISGGNAVTYKVTARNKHRLMQIDLKESLLIDSIVQDGRQFSFKKKKWGVVCSNRNINKRKGIHC